MNSLASDAQARSRPYHNLYVIGLTGNIGCGKSAVVAMLARRGVHVLDADAVTRLVMETGQPAYRAIVEHFGNGILIEQNGPIDRPALGRVVFGDPDKLRQLEMLVHPATRMYIYAWLEAQDGAAAKEGNRQIVVIDAIKLLEGGYPEICNAVWVVTCDPEVQIRRLVEQRGMLEADARQRIGAQPSQSDKIKAADVVIDNSGQLAETERQVDAAWHAINAIKHHPGSDITA